MSRRALAVAAVLEAAVLLFVVFRFLPVRVPAVDQAVVFVVALRVASAFALLLRPNATTRRFAALALGLLLVLGAGITTAILVSASMVAGSYGPVGAGTSVVLVLLCLLVLPYLVAFPALQLRFVLGLPSGDEAA